MKWPREERENLDKTKKNYDWAPDSDNTQC
jgi:hypothetical protein